MPVDERRRWEKQHEVALKRHNDAWDLMHRERMENGPTERWRDLREDVVLHAHAVRGAARKARDAR